MAGKGTITYTYDTAGSLGIYGRYFPTSTPANPMSISRNGVREVLNAVGQPYYLPSKKRMQDAENE